MSFDHAKAVVRRFNEQVIAGGDLKAFEALIAVIVCDAAASLTEA